MDVEVKNRISVTIMDEEYLMKSSAGAAEIEQAARIVDERMRSVGERNPRLGLTKVAVLAAVNIADELRRLQDRNRELSERVVALERKKGIRRGEFFGEGKGDRG
ncbi:MAG: cell division protein ZapA [Firmicutes bacterium]|nr:cell division protein ZapA [Bacillota bacterium]